MSDEKGGRRRRNRSRGRAKGGAGQSSSQPRQQKGRKPAPRPDPAEFWGDPARLPDPDGGLTHSPNVQAVITSLGRPPLSGHETAAEHWFSLVYERAAFLAGALAAAGGLDQPDPTDGSL